MTRQKHNDSALNPQSAKKKRFSHLQQRLLMNHPRRGTRRAAIANAGRLCCAGHCGATHCSLCLHADIILFRQKQQQRRGDRGGSPYVLCRHSVVRHQYKEFCSSAITSSLSLAYFMSKLKTDDEKWHR